MERLNKMFMNNQRRNSKLAAFKTHSVNYKEHRSLSVPTLPVNLMSQLLNAIHQDNSQQQDGNITEDNLS